MHLKCYGKPFPEANGKAVGKGCVTESYYTDKRMLQSQIINEYPKTTKHIGPNSLLV